MSAESLNLRPVPQVPPLFHIPPHSSPGPLAHAFTIKVKGPFVQDATIRHNILQFLPYSNHIHPMLALDACSQAAIFKYLFHHSYLPINIQ